jgi:hypothetical protein
VINVANPWLCAAATINNTNTTQLNMFFFIFPTPKKNNTGYPTKRSNKHRIRHPELNLDRPEKFPYKRKNPYEAAVSTGAVG